MIRSETWRTTASSSFFLRDFEEVFEFEADVEMIFNGGFAAAGHHNNVGDAGMNGLFDAVLDDGLVDKRQHLFRLGLGGGKETGSETGGRENGFANFRCWHMRFYPGTLVVCGARARGVRLSKNG